jgi:predicted Zn-dependent protease
MTSLSMADALPLLGKWRQTDGGAELLLKQSLTRHWSLERGVLQTSKGRERGAAVRVVLADGRSSLVAAAVPTINGLRRDLGQALLLARDSAPDPHLTLPGAVPGQDQLPPRPAGPSPAGRSASDTAKDILQRLQQSGSPAARILKCWVTMGDVVTELANTAGAIGYHRMELTSLGVLLAGNHSEPLGHQELFPGIVTPDPQRFLEAALTRAAGVFGPPARAPGSRSVLVLTPEAAAPLLAAIGSRFVPLPDHPADVPPFAEPGVRVAQPGITLVDDGLHPGGLRNAAFDGEGTPARTTVLVRDGVMESLVHDRRSASRAGTSSTGNAIRDSYRQWPVPGLTTLVLRPLSGLVEDDLTSDVSRGLCAIDAAPPDPDRLAAGLFSIRLRGRLIHNGRLRSPAGPVRFQLPLAELLPRLRAAAGQPRTVVLDGCVESPMIRLDGVLLEHR